MTLDELLEQLKQLKDHGVDGSTTVRLAYDNGDYFRFIACSEITDVVQAYTKRNGYIDEESPLDEEEDLEVVEVDRENQRIAADECYPKETPYKHPLSCVVLSNISVHPWRQ